LRADQRALEGEPEQDHDQRADHNQHEAVGAVSRDADVELALQRLRQHELLVLRPDQQRHRGAQREHKADGEQHLVELGRPVEPPVEQAFHGHADERDDDKAEQQRRHEAEPQPLH
jgi:hypothetical protein